MTAGRILGLAALCTLCGCSLLLDTDDYRAVAEPGEVRIGSLESAQALEGARVPAILRGTGFARSASVEAVVVLPDGTEEPVAVREKRVSSNRTELGLLLDIPVLPGHDPGADAASVRITVSQGRWQASIGLPIVALPELVLQGDNEQLIDTSQERPEVYSRIEIDSPVTVVGDRPLRLVATRSIAINRAIQASGRDATANEPGAGGPGGCEGGVGGVNGGPGLHGGCDLGGGRAGAGASGTGPALPGGGGGCAATEGSSRDETRGVDTCTRELVPLGPPDNRGHGGGGGGAFESDAGGHGGGGGGAIEISAPFVSFSVTGTLSARGGNGSPGAAQDCGQNRHAGAGGGGSGGTVLLRADTVLFHEEDLIAVHGGEGGVTCQSSGGGGSDGQVRIDVASVQLGEELISAPERMVDFFSRNFWRGPRLAETTPRVVLSGLVPIEVRGNAEVAYDLMVDSSPPIQIRGSQTLALMLEPGLREVCVVTRSVPNPDAPESKHCLTIAVLDS